MKMMEKLRSMIVEHPEMEVKFFVDNESTLDPCEYSWTNQTISEIKKSWWWSKDGESIFIDEDEIREEMNNLSVNADEEERMKEIDERFKKEAKEVILIWLSA